MNVPLDIGEGSPVVDGEVGRLQKGGHLAAINTDVAAGLRCHVADTLSVRQISGSAGGPRWPRSKHWTVRRRPRIKSCSPGFDQPDSAPPMMSRSLSW